MTSDLAALKEWVGRRTTLEDRIHPFPMLALSATLDRDDPAPKEGDPLPPVWHWLYFLPIARAGEVGPDGHPKRGGFLPPVPLPRRMWAGSRLTFHRPLQLGETIRRESEIGSVDVKQGRAGTLVFVLVKHQIFCGHGLAIDEEHDIVYREPPAPGAPPPPTQPAPSDAVWRRQITPDPVLLFRYSALTFNGHRIHYDRSYVTGEEGYPGLVVHGPLLATLLLDLVRREAPAETVSQFTFRAVSPLFDIAPFSVNGKPEGDGAKLWAAGDDGRLAMQASVTFKR